MTYVTYNTMTYYIIVALLNTFYNIILLYILYYGIYSYTNI